MAGFSFGTPTTAAPSFSFGNTVTNTGGVHGMNFGSPAANPAATTLQFNTPGQTAGTVSFAAPSPGSGSGLTFGSAGGLNIGTPATSQGALSFKPGGLGGGLNFGTTGTQQSSLNFGSPATTTATLPTFGSTPSTNQQTLTFGSTPATSQPLTFGSSLATTQPLNFGTTPSTSQPLSFGSSLGSTQPSLSFGTTPSTTLTGLTPATCQPLNFGASTPATSTTAGLSFGLGSQPAVTKPTVSFGLTTTIAATTTATSLLNFPAPKTSTTTGFSLSVSTGTGTGSLFSLPTTSAVTTTAPPVFKGLGGVDTSTNLGSGQKDAKSVKENTVFPELVPTLDTLKNFVKQQKSLSCEVSRAPVKPMHKVTEDTEALRQMLTTVSSALQKNRVVANKLKIDTTKCLALCEMAQRTHDTPPGLQNDNAAPLEFFVELVSKFERDIQVLRQEIDNTEKHVNSLAYPAILTPQELSVALRRLHDSFVALAGRLQTAHSGVIAQKERHLSLRRHFLKDTTNIFENSSKAAASTKKQQYISILPMTGPTPFSSLTGVHNFNIATGQDKPVTFSSGTNSISGWGSSGATNLNIAATPNFLNPPGSTALNNQQAVDNQNFQLGKPPPGNKRGKR